MGLGPTVDYLSVFCRGDYIGLVVHQTMDPDFFVEDTALTRTITQQMAADIDRQLLAAGQTGCAFEGEGTTASSPAGSADNGGGGIPWPPIIIGAGAVAAGGATVAARRRRPASGSGTLAEAPECVGLRDELAALKGRYSQLQEQVSFRNNRLARIVEARERIELVQEQISALRAQVGVENIGGASSDTHTAISMATGAGALRAEAAREAAEIAAEQAVWRARVQRLLGQAAVGRAECRRCCRGRGGASSPRAGRGEQRHRRARGNRRFCWPLQRPEPSRAAP